MNKVNLDKALAKAQSEHDYLITELGYVDTLLKNVGFAEGITTLKAAAEEIVDSGIADA